MMMRSIKKRWKHVMSKNVISKTQDRSLAWKCRRDPTASGNSLQLTIRGNERMTSESDRNQKDVTKWLGSWKISARIRSFSISLLSVLRISCVWYNSVIDDSYQ
jgi:hypothetical protein